MYVNLLRADILFKPPMYSGASNVSPVRHLIITYVDSIIVVTVILFALSPFRASRFNCIRSHLAEDSSCRLQVICLGMQNIINPNLFRITMLLKLAITFKGLSTGFRKQKFLTEGEYSAGIFL